MWMFALAICFTNGQSICLGNYSPLTIAVNNKKSASFGKPDMNILGTYECCLHSKRYSKKITITLP